MYFLVLVICEVNLMLVLICYRFLIVIKCEVVSAALEAEVKADVKIEESGVILKPKQETDVKSEVKNDALGIILKPKQEVVAKSAAQIMHEQNGK